MEKIESPKKDPNAGQKHSFTSTLENIAAGMEYYALSVPQKITKALGTQGAVPVMARVQNSEPFLASLYPVGEGQHYLRVKNKICKSVNIQTGDKVKVEIIVRDRLTEIVIPNDLHAELKKAKLKKEFESLPVGKKSHLLRLVEQAVKPETRAKRISDTVSQARARKL